MQPVLLATGGTHTSIINHIHLDDPYLSLGSVIHDDESSAAIPNFHAHENSPAP